MAEPIELKSRTITGRRDGPHLLVIGGVHGDEFEPMLTCRRLLGEIEPASLSGRLTVIPCVNEPAFARCQRTGEDNLDLARVCPGDVNGSLTQRIAAALSQHIRSADALIDLHTAGHRYRMLQLAGYSLHPDAAVLERQRSMAKAFGLPVVWGTNARFNGTSLSVARDALKPAIYVENGGGATFDPAGVDLNVFGCRQVLRSLGMLDEPVETRPVRYFVEDDRDHSGHLQRQHPSPAAGFFVSAVTLGEVVTPGQVIGHVTNHLGDECHEVVAADAGVVNFLRVFPSVQAGDALMALLPITSPGEVRYKRMKDEA
jgi:predicted deacylase